ncbi:hypothetical protein O1611_g7179 [Lasiodiplodia mahajangana]|uniref:Uncharacterized protein n=1 Tax=Lasiodiplodia mahajangana TaxID=1108764 RepID=A0ACC2JGN2_9PEZI|nr:hypothetical protein O1611_g7179 [Lasiodiplodia mahajangana]
MLSRGRAGQQSPSPQALPKPTIFRSSAYHSNRCGIVMASQPGSTHLLILTLVPDRTTNTNNPNDSRLQVVAELDSVTHGQNAGILATSIVITFRLKGISPERRFREIRICTQFESDTGVAGRDPEVAEARPDGHFILSTTEGIATEPTIEGASVPTGPASTHKSATWTRARRTPTTTDGGQTYLISKTKKGRQSIRKNTVHLTLQENRNQESELVTVLQTSILLHRRNKDNFTAYMTATATAEWSYADKEPTQRQLETSSDRMNICTSDAAFRFDPSQADPIEIIPVVLDNTAFGRLDKPLTKRDNV